MTAMKSYEKLFKKIVDCLAAELGLKKTVSFRPVEDQSGKISYVKDCESFRFLRAKDRPLSIVSNLDDKDALKLNPLSTDGRKALGEGHALIFKGYGRILRADRSYIELFVLSARGTVSVTVINGKVSCSYVPFIRYQANGVNASLRRPHCSELFDRVSRIALACAEECPVMKRTSPADVYVITEAGGQKETAPTLSACDAVLGRIARSIPSGGSVEVSISRRRMTAVHEADGTVTYIG